jgi:Domain of unknown function (DUF5047)
MHPVTARFLTALTASHTVVVSADAYRAGVLIQADLPILDGSVTVDAASGARRQLTLTVADPGFLPVAETAPYGVEITTARGIRYPDGATELVPLGVFTVETMTATDGGPVTVTGPDRAKTVTDARFLTPHPSDTGHTVAEEIEDLVLSALPAGVTAAFTNTGDLGGDATPSVVWDRERWDAVQELATGVGAEVFFDAAGDVALRPVPAITDPIVWVARVGPAGALTGHTRGIGRTDTYNVVVALGERTDGAAPVRYEARDDTPTSPTYTGGPFGVVPFFYTSPLLHTAGGAEAAARALLARKRALGREVDFTAVPNPALDAGDVIAVAFTDGTLERHIVDRVTIPLTPTGLMGVTTRTGDPALNVEDLDPAYPPDPDPGETPPPGGDTPTTGGGQPPDPQTADGDTITQNHTVTADTLTAGWYIHYNTRGALGERWVGTGSPLGNSGDATTWAGNDPLGRGGTDRQYEYLFLRTFTEGNPLEKMMANTTLTAVSGNGSTDTRRGGSYLQFPLFFSPAWFVGKRGPPPATSTTPRNASTCPPHQGNPARTPSPPGRPPNSS